MWNYSAMINGVAVSTVQQAMMPVILAVAARFVFAEPFTLRKSAALMLTLGGTVLISGLLSSRRGPGGVVGLLIGLAVPATYALYNLFSKQITERYHPITVLTYGFGFATLVLLPVRLFRGNPVPFSWETAGLLTGLVLAATIFPFAVYTFTLRRFQVSLAGIMSMSEIPFAFLYAFLVFGESLNPLQYAGTGVIILGVLLCLRLRPLEERGRRG
jgi:drug/metabolite transporter (DMT)-like permease